MLHEYTTVLHYMYIAYLVQIVNFCFHCGCTLDSLLLQDLLCCSRLLHYDSFYMLPYAIGGHDHKFECV
jgi:hypothetical protein